ncbi:cellulase family glycosylhydrolase [Myceligenerans crystallogenes]|uniref:Cellulase family glycosylhydrolase n=1 Tax=Myceligenerans crystallogenes TaxID=316335 RepID=A0ABN2NBK9_9MICO
MVAVAVAGLALLAGSVAPATAQPAARHAPASAADVVAAMQPGWNLGNTLDALGPDETAWGNPRVTRQLLDEIEDQGFRSVRIPVSWGQHQGGAPGYAVDPVWMDRVEEVVDLALDEDLMVLLNIHHDSWTWANAMPAEHDAVVAQYDALWEQIAERFRDHPREVLFESINEPQFAGVDDATSYTLLDELNTRFHEIVRASGGGNADRVLVLPTLHTNADQGRLDALNATFDELADPNLAATVHFYGYWPFSVNVAGGFRFDATARADADGTFQRVHDSFTARGIPVILGEFGLLGFDRHTGTIEQGEKLKFFEYTGNLARTTDVTTMLWDNGQHFDRTAFTWRDKELFAYLSTSWVRRSGTASSDLVFVDADGAATARTVTLEPHGTSFRGVYEGPRALRAGRDYTRSGDTLTLSAALLGRLAGSGATGERATLRVKYSSGLPWKLHVIRFGTPELGAAQGTTDGFAIPTSFDGDRLATMEARYADDGTNAGPHNWTSYKEYDVAFTPDEANGAIILRPAFFNEVADARPVRLTFHFWSGEKVSYTVTREGTAVSGAAG